MLALSARGLSCADYHTHTHFSVLTLPGLRHSPLSLSRRGSRLTATRPRQHDDMPRLLSLLTLVLCAALALAGGKKDYYEILGLDKSADADKIKKSFRKLSLKYHPGAWGAALCAGRGGRALEACYSPATSCHGASVGLA